MTSKLVLLATGAVLTATVASAPIKSADATANTLVPKATNNIAAAVFAGDEAALWVKPSLEFRDPSSSDNADLSALHIEQPADLPPRATSSTRLEKRLWGITCGDDRENCCLVM